MSLIFIFAVAVAFVFINIEPFTFTGAFLTACYLPGLCFIAIGKQDSKLTFEDHIFSIPSSVGLSSLAAIGLLFAGVQITYILFIIQGCVGVALLLFLARGRGKKECFRPAFGREELNFILFAAIITLILSIPFFIGPNRGPISSHAFHHSSLISQILNGIFPPQNPGMGGTTIGYYWGFHALIAAVATQTALHHLQVVFIFNAIALLMIFCTAYCFLRNLGLDKKFGYLFVAAILGIMHFDAGLLVAGKLAAGKLPSHKELLLERGYVLPTEIFYGWIKGLPWLDTRLFFLKKFYNITAMPVALSFCFSYLLLVLLHMKKGYGEKVYSVVLGLILIASLINYPPLAIYILAHAPVWAVFTFLSCTGAIRDRVREVLHILIPYAAGVLVVLPYVLLVVAGRAVSSSGQGEIVGIAFHEQSVKNVVAFLLPLPAIAAGAWIMFRRRPFSREMLFVLISASICLVLSIFTRWPFNNSYKFAYILVFFFALFSVYSLSGLLSRMSRVWVSRSIYTTATIMLLLTPIVIEASYIMSCMTMDRFFVFDRGHILYAGEREQNEAFEWIRDNTPADALIMMSYFETPVPYSGLNPNYEVAAISERNLYVIKDTDYTTSNPEYQKRVDFRQRLFDSPEDRHVADFFSTLGRPVYLLLEDGLPDRFLVEDRFDEFPDNPGEPFELVFRNDRQRVYLIRY